MGAKKEGVPGFFKGVAKGLGGAVLKPGAGMFCSIHKIFQRTAAREKGPFADEISALWDSWICIQRHPPGNPKPFRCRSSELHRLCSPGGRVRRLPDVDGGRKA